MTQRTSRCFAVLVAGLICAAALEGRASLAENYQSLPFAGIREGVLNGAALEASFRDLRGFAADTSGNMVLADRDDHRIRFMSAAGQVTTLAGSGVSGSADGVGTAASFRQPSDAAFGPDGSVYVADTGNHTIRRIASDGTVSTIAGSAGVIGTADGVGTAARFSSPWGVVVATDGTVYVADTENHTIRRVAVDGTVTTLAGQPNVSGTANGTGAAARFFGPTGLAIGPTGDIFVADRLNHAIRRVTSAGVVTTYAGVAGDQGVVPGPTVPPGLQSLNSGVTDGPAADARFALPSDLVIDDTGQMFVTSAVGERVVHPCCPTFNYFRGLLRVISSAGVVSTRAEIAPHANVTLRQSQVVVTQDQSQVPATPPDLLISADGAGVKTRVAGTHPCSILTRSGPRFGAGLCTVAGIGLAPDGTVYSTDPDSHAVIRITRDGTVTQFAGGFQQAGLVDGSGADSRFNTPIGVAVDTSGNVFVADSANMVIRRITSAGVVSTYAGTPGAAGSGDGSRDVARFNLPHDLAVGPDGSLYVADAGNATIRRITPAGVVSTVGGAPGESGYVDGPAAASRFNGVFGVAVDASGHVYVADLNNHVLRRISAQGTVTTVAGSAGVSGRTDGVGSAARFSSPRHVAVTSTGVVLVHEIGTPGTAVITGALRQVAPDGTVVTVSTGLYKASHSGGLAVDASNQVLHGSVYGGIVQFVTSSPSAPAVSSHPANQSVSAGNIATFTVALTSVPVPVVQWQSSSDAGVTWSDVSNGSGVTGANTTTLQVTGTAALNGRRYRATAFSALGTATSNVATLTVSGFTASPSALAFAARRAGPVSAPIMRTTAAQTVTVQPTGFSSTPAWTATANQTWVQITNGTGTGAGQFTVAVDGAAFLTVNGTFTATITISSGGVTATVPVTLDVYPDPVSMSPPPFGLVDTPMQDSAGVTGAIAMTGWALDDVGVEQIIIYRSCLPSEVGNWPCHSPGGLRGLINVVQLGYATIVPGARPDVEGLYPTYPAAQRAGWGFMILSNMLPDVPGGTPQGGVGPIELWAMAWGEGNDVTVLGRTLDDRVGTRVTLANNTIAKPFGAIDTPTQGQTVSGTINNFGWALTPDPGTSVLIPIDGSTITVFVDGAAIGTATYNLCRGSVAVGGVVPTGVLCNDDVSTAFRGDGTRFRNLDAGRGPIGLRSLNTRTLTNGLHTLSWAVTDSANRSEGIGSRYINVVNASADPNTSDIARRSTADPVTSGVIYARTGFDDLSAYTPLVANAEGVPQVRIPELGRVELRIPGATSGVLIVNGESRALPIGVGIDTQQGLVTWAPGVAYLGTYRLSFDGTVVDVTVMPASSVAEPMRMHLDSPVRGEIADGRLRVEGWALDPHSSTGAGIGAVHVWATRSDNAAQAGLSPVFLGAADLAIARPDVAAAHGAQFPEAGFRLLTSLPAGEWDMTAYVWVSRTGRFEDARSVRVVVR